LYAGFPWQVPTVTATVPPLTVPSDARVLDTLLHNSDRCSDHLMMAQHWSLGERGNDGASGGWKGRQWPVFIDHAAGFRPGAEVRMEHQNAFKTGPTTVVSSNTLTHLRCVVCVVAVVIRLFNNSEPTSVLNLLNSVAALR
jgi:hypothetical protein